MPRRSPYRPVVGGRRDNRKSTVVKILLVDKGLVAGNENVDAGFFSSAQPFTVFEMTPTHNPRQM